MPENKKKIYVADDNKDWLDTIAEYLQESDKFKDHEVIKFNSLEKLAAHMDFKMNEGKVSLEESKVPNLVVVNARGPFVDYPSYNPKDFTGFDIAEIMKGTGTGIVITSGLNFPDFDVKAKNRGIEYAEFAYKANFSRRDFESKCKSTCAKALMEKTGLEQNAGSLEKDD